MIWLKLVRMRPSGCHLLECLVAEHGVEGPFIKRHRDKMELGGRQTRTRNNNE